MKKYLKYLSLIPLFAISYVISFYSLLRIPDRIWGCQGFGCFGLVFFIPQLAIIPAIVLTIFIFFLLLRYSNYFKDSFITFLTKPFPKKKLILLLIAIPVFIIILIIVTSIKNPNNEISNWETHTNNTYGFSISYPSIYKITTLEPYGESNFQIAISANNFEYGLIYITLFDKYENFKEKVNSTFNGLPSYDLKRSKNDSRTVDSIYLKSPVTNNYISFTYNYGQNDKDKKTIDQILSTFKFIDQSIPTPTIPTSSWKTFNSNLFSFKYPADYSTVLNGEKITVHPQPSTCKTGASFGSSTDYLGYDTEITVIHHTGENFEDIWKNTYNFDLYRTENGKRISNFDGETILNNKHAYYFYQGAEMVYSRTAYLVKLTSTSALEINLWSPELLFDCIRPLNKTEGTQISKTILSTFQFLNENQTVLINSKCAIYQRGEKKIESCASCNNYICELYETCTASVCDENQTICTDDCGALYCPADCK